MRCTSVRFVDTNVVLYAVSRAPGEEKKAESAQAILTSRDIALSTQVLQEFYVQATRPGREDRLEHVAAFEFAESLLRFPVQEITSDIVLAAFALSNRFGISYWDAAILEASRALGCDVVLSEDLSHGADYDGVRVENPFRAEAA